MDLYKELLAAGFDKTRAKRAMVYSPMFEGDVRRFIASVSEILAREDAAESSPPLTGHGRDREPYISNHTSYGYEGSENFEHDDTGAQMNYSGVVDDVVNAIAEHEGYEEGYDYGPSPGRED